MTHTASPTVEMTVEQLDARIANAIANPSVERIVIGSTTNRIDGDHLVVSVAISVHYADDITWDEIEWVAVDSNDATDESTYAAESWGRQRVRDLYLACDSITGGLRPDDVIDITVAR